jgi:hypothetical protein
VEVEQKMVTFPIDTHLQENIQALANDGWQLNPSAPPVAVYHLMRPKQSAEAPTMGFKMTINEDLVQVVKAPQP